MKTLLLLLLFTLPTHSAPNPSPALNAPNPSPTAQDYWAVVDSAFGAMELCEAFPHGENLNFEHSSCFGGRCDTWTYYSVAECYTNPPAAHLMFFKAYDNRQFSSQKITAADWEKSGRNPLRLKAQQVESFGQKFSLTDIQPSSDSIKVKYKIESQRVGGQLQLVGEGYWIIKPNGKSALQKMSERSHTTFAAGKETTVERLK